MSTFTRSIRKVFENAGRSFLNYPAVIGNALLFTLVALVRITMDWEAQLPYEFFFNTLQMALALGAIFSLAAVTWAHSRANTRRAFLLANAAGFGVALLTFLLLYFLGGTVPKAEMYQGSIPMVITTMAKARVFVAGLLSLFAFLLLAGQTRDKLDFSGALFMTLKAFFLALIYGLVIMAGVSGVFGAVQALLYADLSSKVYQYVASISGFIGFSIFVGYFPDFRRDSVDEHRETAQMQPRFITVLLEFILVPIMLALTIVLLLWAGQTILGGMDTNFTTLNSIAASFAIGGLLLHILITKNDSGIARFYKKVFPIAALLILLFEAWALVIQLGRYGMKTTEYLFIIIWIIALASAALLILKKEGAHRYIVYLTSGLAVLAVLPLIGFTDLPFMQQTGRLEKLLVTQNMLVNGKIVPATVLPSMETREAISSSVDFLVFADSPKYPDWLDPEALKNDGFKASLGFDRVYPDQEPRGNENYRGVTLFLTPGPIDIRDFEYHIPFMTFMKEPAINTTFTGTKGDYEIKWQQEFGKVPTLEILLNGNSILKQDMTDYLAQSEGKYPTTDQYQEIQSGPEGLTWFMESSELKVMLVFARVEISITPENESKNFAIDLNSIYLHEK